MALHNWSPQQLDFKKANQNKKQDTTGVEQQPENDFEQFCISIPSITVGHCISYWENYSYKYL